jgi:1-acylglycerone phosphate reductase
MKSLQKSVLITGCSDGGLGAALAIAFHEAGFQVYATARNVSKMKEIASLGIQTLTLDVLSDQSILDCVNKIPSLDILVNNAGAQYAMPVSDLSIAEAKQLFDLNVWSFLTVTQAFLPMLLKSKGMVVNQTSISSVLSVPFLSTYSASKAAMAMFSDTQRLEFAPLGITVVELKTGGVTSNIGKNHKLVKTVKLPDDSVYAPARETVEKTMDGESLEDGSEAADVWAKNVVGDLMKKTPPPVIWRGNRAGLVRILSALPGRPFDGMLKQATRLDIVEKAVRK